MSKSRDNAIGLRDDEDRTAALLRKAKTDSQRTITYDPEHRPEVAGLLLTAALCAGRSPIDIADELAGRRGAPAGGARGAGRRESPRPRGDVPVDANVAGPVNAAVAANILCEDATATAYAEQNIDIG